MLLWHPRSDDDNSKEGEDDVEEKEKGTNDNYFIIAMLPRKSTAYHWGRAFNPFTPKGFAIDE